MKDFMLKTCSIPENAYVTWVLQWFYLDSARIALGVLQGLCKEFIWRLQGFH